MLAADKKAARAEARDRRDAAHSAERSAKAAAHLRSVLDGFGDADLAGYLPIRSEVDPRPAMAAHRGAVGVPHVLGKEQPLGFLHWTPQVELIEGAFGVMIPARQRPVVPRVLIVPMLAFDGRGYRLGYGGGFYDRTLEKLRATGDITAIGLAYSAQMFEALPVEDTDQPLDMIVTEDGVLAMGSGAA